MKIKIFAYLILALTSISISAQTASISPNKFKRGDSNKPFSIIGKGTHFSQGTHTFNFHPVDMMPWPTTSITFTSLVVVNDTLMNGRISLDSYTTLGFCRISMRNNIDNISLDNNGIEVIAPPPPPPNSAYPIVNITPNKGKQGDTIDISVICANTSLTMNPSGLALFFYKGSSNIIDTNLTPIKIDVTSPTDFIATVAISPNASVGLYDVYYGMTIRYDKTTTFSYESRRINAFTVNPSNVGTKSINTLNAKVYPNPVQKIISIESKESIEEINVYDVMGKEITQQIPEKESLNYQLDLSELLLPKGIYVIKIHGKNTSSTQKIILE